MFAAKLSVIVLVAVLGLPSKNTPAGPAASSEQAGLTLQSIQRDIENDYPAVKHIKSGDLGIVMETQTGVVVFDVRAREEYAVSRLKGAIRVDPDIGRTAFLDRYGAKTTNRLVIFYCSVGVRSSRLAERVQNKLRQRGALSVRNLEGGIFNWHNEFRALASKRGATRYVHPYDDRWGQLLKRRHLARYAPMS